VESFLILQALAEELELLLVWEEALESVLLALALVLLLALEEVLVSVLLVLLLV